MLIDGNAAVGVPEDTSGAQRPFPNRGILPEAPSSAVEGEDDNRLQQTLFGVEKFLAARHSYWLYL
jgi:hypothetical protein